MNTELITFLKQLEKNNSKEWFDGNRKNYETLRLNFIDFTQLLINEIAKFDSTVANVDPKKSIFRINRDIRFSKNKAPYKTNFGAYINARGKKTDFAGYYLHLEPNKSFLAGGMWQPQPNILSKIRQEIDYNSAEFLKIVESKKSLEYFGGIEKTDVLKNLPKGYDTANEYSEYLKLKSFVFTKSITDEELLDPNFAKKSAVYYKQIFLLNTFLNRVLDDEALL